MSARNRAAVVQPHGNAVVALHDGGDMAVELDGGGYRRVDRIQQHRLQIAPMHVQIGLAVAGAGPLAQRCREQRAATLTIDDVQRSRLERNIDDGVQDTQAGQHVIGVGRQLNSCANGLQAIRLFEHDDVETRLTQGQGCGQTADTGTDDRHASHLLRPLSVPTVRPMSTGAYAASLGNSVVAVSLKIAVRSWSLSSGLAASSARPRAALSVGR